MSIQGRLEVLSDWSYPDRNRPPVHTSQVELGCPQNWKSGNKILSPNGKFKIFENAILKLS